MSASLLMIIAGAAAILQMNSTRRHDRAKVEAFVRAGATKEEGVLPFKSLLQCMTEREANQLAVAMDWVRSQGKFLPEDSVLLKKEVSDG